MTACPTPDRLGRMIEGVLAAPEQGAVEDHVNRCPACQDALERLTAGPAPAGREIDPMADTFVARVQALAPPAAGPRRVAGPAPLPAVPGYEVEAEIGRGGMGVVYRARHKRLNRLVALKMLTEYGLVDPGVRARFLVEAEAVAQLQHPDIVRVYEFGEHAGRPYLAMEYVAGGTLADRLAAGPPLAPPARVAGLVARLADAVAAAHQKGIIHRDLKPGNVLLAAPEQAAGADPDPVPKVTDFGIARIGRSDLTATGEVLGTPSYMAPEQAAGRPREVGTATDVYGLGAILYELLVGRPPFLGDTAVATLQDVVHTAPRPPRSVARGVPRDLDTICQKCLEKSPGRRYPTADALAADLRAYIAGRAISARPARAWEKAVRLAKRNPVPTAAGTLVAAAAVISVAVLWGSYREVQDALKDKAQQAEAAEAAQQLGQVERRRAERLATRTGIDQGFRLCDDGDVAQGLEHFAVARELADAAGDADLGRVARLNEAAALARLPRRTARYDLAAINRPVDAVAVTRDGRVVTVAGDAGEARVWTDGPGGGGTYQTWPGVPRIARFKQAYAVAAFTAPDGETVYVAHADGRVWSRAARDPVAKVTSFEFVRVTGASLIEAGLKSSDPDSVFPTLHSAALSPDGRRVAAGFANGQVRVMDVAKKTFVGAEIVLGGRIGVYGLGFTEDGRLVAGGRGTQVSVWTPPGEGGGGKWAGTTAFRVEGGAYRMAVRRVGTRELVLVGGDVSASLWDLGNPAQPLHVWPYPRRVGATAFSPDGRACVVADHAGNVRCWDTLTGDPVAEFRHPSQVRAVAFAAGGRRLVVGGADGRAVAWELPASRVRADLMSDNRSPGVAAVGFERDGVGLWTASGGGLKLWRPAEDGEYREDPTRAGGARTGSDVVRTAALGPDGETAVVTGWHSTTMRVARVSDPPPDGRGPDVGAGVEAIGFVPGGDSFFTVSGEPVEGKGRLRWWRVGPKGAAEDDARTWPALPYAACVAARPPAGDLVLVGQQAGQPTGFRAAATGSLVGPALPHPRAATVTAAAFDPSGSLAATGCQDGSVRVWDVATRALVAGPFFHKDRINQLAFGNGTSAGWLAAASDDGTVRFWDARTGLPIGQILRHPGPALAVAFAPGGDRVITGARSGPVRVWAVPPPPPADLPGAGRAAGTKPEDPALENAD